LVPGLVVGIHSVFFFFFFQFSDKKNWRNLTENLVKLVEFAPGKKKNSKNFPIYWSKIDEISPKKKILLGKGIFTRKVGT